MPSSTSPPPHDSTPSSARSLSPPFSLHIKHDDLFAYAADHGSRTGRVSPPNLHELGGEALFGRSPLSPTSRSPPASPRVDYTAPTTMHETALPVTDPASVQREREARKKLRERYMVSLSGNEKLEKMLQILQEGAEYAARVKGEKGRGGSGEEPRWKAGGEKSIREGGRADPTKQNKTASPSKQTARGESPSSSPSRRHRPKLPLVDSGKAQSIREGTPPLTPPATTSLLDSPVQSITSSHCTKRRENSSTKVASDPRTPNGDMTREHERFFTASEGGDSSGERAARPHSSNSPRSSTFRSPGQFHVDAFGSPKLGTARSPPPSPAYLDSRSPRLENCCSPLHSPPPFSPPYEPRPTSPTSPGTAALANPRSLTPMPSLPSSPLAFDKPRPALFRTLGYGFLPSRSMSRTHGVDDELTEEEKQWAELSRKVRDDGRGRDWWGMPIGFGGNWGKSILTWRAPTSSSSDSVLSEERCHERRARCAKESEKLTQIEENSGDSFVQAELEMPDYESFISGSNGIRRSLGSMQNDAFSSPPPRPGQPLKPYRRGPFPVPELTEAEKEERRRKRKLGISPEIDAAPGESKAELRRRAWEEWLLFDQEKQRLVAQLSHEASPNDAQVYNALAKLHLRAPIPSAREFAEQLLVQSLQIDEGQPEIASLLARCIEGRDPKEAIRCRIALRHDPHSPDHHLNLATALQRASSPNSAADAYAGLARGFVDSPWEPIALFRLGQLAEDLHGLNDRLRAADAFEKALESLKRLSLLAPSLAKPGPWEALDELERVLLDALDRLRAAPNEHTSRSIDIYHETSLTLDHILAGLQHMSRSTAAAELAESSRRLAQQVDRSFERMKKAAEEDTLRRNALLKSLEDLSRELTTLPERLVSTARLMAKRPPHVAPPPPPPDPLEILLRKLEQARRLSRGT
ncbi:hypothetical protein JCM21900_002185 [Sporobolomyces salmonicolor]